MKYFFQLNSELWKNRKIIFSMGKSEFRNEYAGSALGIIWGIFKPFMLVAVYSLVFSGSNRDGVPFLIWVVPGLFLWTFLSDSLLSGTSAIRGNSHLVKKVVFPVSILPSTKIINHLFNHFIFMSISFLLLALLKMPFHWQMLQLIYYLVASIIFTIVVTRLLSAMAVMSVDIMHFITTIMQLLFWTTPVLWSSSHAPAFTQKVLPILKLNPYYYLVEGYRNSFFSLKWFWEAPVATLYFWTITLILGIIGSYYYKRTRNEFADVL